MNKKSLAALAVLSSAAMAASASASLLMYEPFDQNVPAGTNISGLVNASSGNTWYQTGGTLGTDHQTASGNLTGPTGFPASTGNSAVLENAAEPDYDKITLNGGHVGESNPGNIYYSFLIDVPSISGLTVPSTNVNAGNDVLIGFNNQPATAPSTSRPQNWGASVVIRLNNTTVATSTGYNLGIRSSGTASGAGNTYWSGSLTPGTTNLVVVEYAASGTTGQSVSSVWINPDSSNYGAANAPAADGSSIGDITNTNNSVDYIESLTIGAGIATGAAPSNTDMDEIRVGTTWADVTAVPEPASLGLLGLAATALVGRRRKMA